MEGIHGIQLGGQDTSSASVYSDYCETRNFTNLGIILAISGEKTLFVLKSVQSNLWLSQGYKRNEP